MGSRFYASSLPLVRDERDFLPRKNTHNGSLPYCSGGRDVVCIAHMPGVPRRVFLGKALITATGPFFYFPASPSSMERRTNQALAGRSPTRRTA